MLGIDPKEYPQIQDKYVLKIWETIRSQSKKRASGDSKTNERYNVEWCD